MAAYSRARGRCCWTRRRHEGPLPKTRDDGRRAPGGPLIHVPPCCTFSTSSLLFWLLTPIAASCSSEQSLITPQAVWSSCPTSLVLVYERASSPPCSRGGERVSGEASNLRKSPGQLSRRRETHLHSAPPASNTPDQPSPPPQPSFAISVPRPQLLNPASAKLTLVTRVVTQTPSYRDVPCKALRLQAWP